jgi:hypothetical protein
MLTPALVEVPTKIPLETYLQLTLTTRALSSSAEKTPYQ